MLVPVSEQVVCNLWWVWLIVGIVAGFVLTMGLGAVLMSGKMSREEEERERINH